MKKRLFGVVAVVLGSACALTWSLPADAQEWLRDRRISEGQGYQAGDFEIHPSIAAQIGYDSNYLGRSDKTGANLANGSPTYPQIATGLLQVTPALSLSTTPGAAHEGEAHGEPPSVSFAAGASGTYREFFAKELENQRNMSAQGNAALTILPGRPWSGSVTLGYTRIIQPTVLGNPDLSYNSDAIVAGVDLATQPGSGTLDWHFGYTFTGTFFEDAGGNPYNNVLHTGYTRGRWRFRPRTALLYDGSIATRSFSNPTGASFIEHTTTPVRARIGLEGLVTPRFSVLGLIGYGGSFTSEFHPNDPTSSQYDSVIGQVELRFFPGGNGAPASMPNTTKPSLLVSKIALGYTRDFQASYAGGYMGIDRGYLRAEYFFAGRFIVTLEGGVGAFEHPNQFFGLNSGSSETTPVLMANAYTDVHADAMLFTEYRFLPSLGINGSLAYVENFSNTQLPVTVSDVATHAQVYDLNYRRVQAFLGLRWFM
jgi:hypothetical protein